MISESELALAAARSGPFPTGMLKNTATGRFHPISLRRSPHAYEPEVGGPARYKSIGHHTAGFDTLSEAINHVVSNSAMRWENIAWEWDGNGIPAMVQTFDDTVSSSEVKSDGFRAS